MAKVTTVIEIEAPDGMKRSELSNMLIKAYNRVVDREVKMLSIKYYHTNAFNEHMSGKAVKGRKPRKTIVNKPNQE